MLCTSLKAQPDSAVVLLQSRLDTPRAFSKHLASPHDPSSFAQSLLAYYRDRTDVHHLVDRKNKQAYAQLTGRSNDSTVAHDALDHVFVGQPAYPAHFRGRDIDWQTSPVKDKEWIWQLHRMYFWSAMARMYAQTGDERFAMAWVDQFQDWAAKNPNDTAHAYAWRSIETGIRGFTFTSLFSYFIDSPQVDAALLVALLNSCYAHAEHLMNHYRSGSNWALMEAEGLAFIAITFPEFRRATAWREEAFRRLNREIGIQVHPDGHQRELAMGYHVGSIRWFLRTYQLAQLNNLTEELSGGYLATLEKMCAVPLKLGLPDGTNVQFGDAWAGTPGQHQKRFAQWASLFDREDFLYLATGGRQGIPPAKTAYALPQSGLYSMRSDWSPEATCVVLKCGPDGGGHCQPDNGTFAFFAGGRNLMPDAGSYIYSGDPEQRAWFRQTAVHQTLTLDKKNAQYAPSLRLWQPGQSDDVLVVENHSYPDLTHRRSVIFVDKRHVVLIDEAYGEAIGDLQLHFQLAPGNAVFDRENNAVRSDYADGWNISIHSKANQPITLEQELGQVSFEYTKKELRPAFCYNTQKESSKDIVRFVTLLHPYAPADEVSKPQIKVLSAPLAKQTEITFIEAGAERHLSFIIPDDK